MSQSLTPAEIVEIFGASENSSTPRVHRDGGSRHFMVNQVLEIALRRHPDTDGLEKQFDAFVDASGGERVSVIDPWRAVANIVRWLRRHDLSSRDDMYVIPSSALKS